MEIKESEKINKYLDLATELKKMEKMMAMVLPIIASALGSVPKDSELRLEVLEVKKESRLPRPQHY